MTMCDINVILIKSASAEQRHNIVIKVNKTQAAI